MSSFLNNTGLAHFWGKIKAALGVKEDKTTIVNHGTADTTFALTPNVLHTWGTVNSLTLTLASGSSTYVDGFWFKFTAGSSFTDLTLPSGVSWVTEPQIEAGKTYEVMIVDGLASYVTSGIGDTVKAKTKMVNHGTADTTYQLAPNEFHIWGEVASLNLTLKEERTEYVSGYWFRFTSGNTPTVVTLPSSVQWYYEDGFEVEANKTYEVTIVDGYACYTDYTSSDALATKTWVETRLATPSVAASGVTLEAVAGSVYTFSTAVTSLAVTLPAVSETAVKVLSIFLTTGASPTVTFTSADGKSIYFHDGYELENNTMYEINALFNGNAWVIGCCIVNTN